MALTDNAFVKAEKIIPATIALLAREVVLPGLVWRDAGGDFKGVKDDTISLRLPAYSVAKTRTLRGGAARVKSRLAQRKVDVTLDTDIYNDVPVTDEEMTLDIVDFMGEIVSPVLRGVVRAYEDLVLAEMLAAPYEHTVEFDELTDDPPT